MPNIANAKRTNPNIDNPAIPKIFSINIQIHSLKSQFYWDGGSGNGIQ